MILFTAASIFCAATFFIIRADSTSPIKREDAIPYSGEFLSYEISDGRYFLSFKGGRVAELYSGHSSLSDLLGSLKEGDRLDLLINPKNNYVIEISSENGVILPLERAEKEIGSGNNAFLWLGIIAYTVFALLLIIMLRGLVDSVKKPRSKKEDK